MCRTIIGCKLNKKVLRLPYRNDAKIAESGFEYGNARKIGEVLLASEQFFIQGLVVGYSVWDDSLQALST